MLVSSQVSPVSITLLSLLREINFVPFLEVEGVTRSYRKLIVAKSASDFRPIDISRQVSFLADGSSVILPPELLPNSLSFGKLIYLTLLTAKRGTVHFLLTASKVHFCSSLCSSFGAMSYFKIALYNPTSRSYA